MTITTPEWVKDAVFYQIFPDRFAQSDRVSKAGLNLEPWDTPPTTYGFKGGDLLGVAEHLDYLQDLGVTAIYFNPIFSAAANHRYHTYDYLNVDPLLGGNAAFRELIDAAHARNIRIVPDGVFNHASRGFWQFHHVLENGIDSPYRDWFNFDPDRLNRRRHFAAYLDAETQDVADAASLFESLEKSIVPLYYDRDSQTNLPLGWLRMIKESIRSLAPMFSTSRMLKEYT